MCSDGFRRARPQVNLFPLFIRKLLPLLTAGIVLITGQWLKPAIEVLPKGGQLPHAYQLRLGFVTIEDVERVLSSKHVVRWYSQNALVVPSEYHDKYRIIPYGIDYYKAEQYRRCLREYGDVPKAEDLFLSPLRATSRVRTILLNLTEYQEALRPYFVRRGVHRIENYTSYCRRLAGSRFVVSPIGDRPDCFRHWEAVGLGVVPVCNCPDALRPLLAHGSDMVYASEADLEQYVRQPSLLSWRFRNARPQREKVFVSFWRKIIAADSEMIQRKTEGDTKQWRARGGEIGRKEMLR